jgi:hypothetical protein
MVRISVWKQMLSGGREHKTTFLCEAGLSAQQLSERLLVEAAVSPSARPGGSAFLYVIRSLSTTG